jgi:hypothetical protein
MPKENASLLKPCMTSLNVVSYAVNIKLKRKRIFFVTIYHHKIVVMRKNPCGIL